MGDVVDFGAIGRSNIGGLSLADYKINQVVHLLRGVIASLPYEHQQVVGGDINNIILYDTCVLDGQDWPCDTKKAMIFLDAFDNRPFE